jgi:hypothetical protein
MNKPPNGPEIAPEDVDRLIARFGDKPNPEKSQEIEDSLMSWKEKFREVQRSHERQMRGGSERDR